MRHDIRCAVSTSGVVSIAERAGLEGWPVDRVGYSDYVDPIDHVTEIPKDEAVRIFIVGDPRDANVPFQTQVSYVNALHKAGLHAWLIRAAAKGRVHHALVAVGLKIVKWCVDGVPSSEIQDWVTAPANR